MNLVEAEIFRNIEVALERERVGGIIIPDVVFTVIGEVKKEYGKNARVEANGN